ncbi:MAG: response regulator transcription factor [Bacteroidia bacterium]|nr:response regulator transcription factor [Bacteroidia bacterium]
MRPIRILLADTAFLVRQGLRYVTSRFPYLEIADEATHSDELYEKCLTHQPDMVIMDYQAPGFFSTEDVRMIRQLLPACEVLVISSGLHRDQVLQVLEFGAKGFLLKECDEAEVVDAIHALMRAEKFMCGRILDMVMERTHAGGDCEPTRLTIRELEIVRMMATGHQTSAIADTLSLSLHTVYTHRKNIMRKLGVTTAAEVILYAIHTALVSQREVSGASER